MKQKVVKIILALQLSIYAVALVAFLIGRLDGIHYVLDGGQVVESDSAVLKILGNIGDVANGVFMFTLIFGSIPSLVLAVLGVVFSLLVNRGRLAKNCYYVSVLNLIVSVFWAKMVIGFNIAWAYPSEPKPSPVYNLTWHILDDSIQDEKITLNLSTWDKEKTATRTLKAGRTKQIRLPDESFREVEGSSENSDTLVFVPYGFFIQWHEDGDYWSKADPYEIILYKKPVIIEDEEAFRMESVPCDATFELCYWDKDASRFVHIESSNGVFYKKDKSEELLLDSEKEYPDSDEQFNLFMSVQSAVYADTKHLITLTYERDKSFLPVKIIRTYMQDDREIKTLNVELNGTQWIKTQYVNESTGEPIANKAVHIYVFYDDNTEGGIYTQTDEEGWLSVQNIPDGVECYAMFAD